jgi:hypothetical protein
VTGGGTGVVSHAVLAYAIADGARVISDFRVMGDQGEAFGQVASVPAAWRALREAAPGGDRTRQKVTAAVNKARRYAWPQVIARHGQLLPVQVADRQLAGIGRAGHGRGPSGAPRRGDHRAPAAGASLPAPSAGR